MTRVPMTLMILVTLAVASACNTHDHPHAGGHSHDGSHSHGDDQAHEGDHAREGEVGQRPNIAITRWSERTELFMEYPALVVGEISRAAIHVTDLAASMPLEEGEVVVTLRSGTGGDLEFRGGLSRPGIFGADLQAETRGFYDMSLRVEGPGVVDVFELGAVRVFAPGERIEHDEADDEGIAFLKEQQWTLDFGARPAEVRALRSSLTVPALLESSPGGHARLRAPVPGHIDPETPLPLPGSRVKKGDVLVRLIPRSEDLRDASTLRAVLVEAQQQHELAQRERSRVARLVEARALPARRLEEAEAALATTAARLEAARQRVARLEALSQARGGETWEGGFVVRAPFDGDVAQVHFALGASVEEDAVLVEIVDTARLHVVGAVPERSAASLDAVDAGELLAGGAEPVALASPLSVGRIIDPVSRSAEVRFKLDNRESIYRVGQSARLRLFLGQESEEIAVPESALVEDAGRPVLFIQTAGESFERRPVRLGARAGGWVHVMEGLERGERVVHRGAYLVRLAAISTEVPAHGHVH